MAATIHPLTEDELPILLELIGELARFERLEHEVAATVDSLRESLFGERASAGALLAHSGGVPAGYAIYFFTFSSFVGRPGIWLEDVYVRPPFRRQGIGRGLIDAVARIGAGRNCGRFEWAALDWNRNALEFYARLGAQVRQEWVLLRMNAAQLKKLAQSPQPK